MTKNQPNPEENSEFYLASLRDNEELVANRLNGIRTVLVVLSSKALSFDREALRNKITQAYPDAAVFFVATSGRPVGVAPPRSVDLVIDFTGPWQFQNIFLPRKLRRMATYIVGRNAWFFRKRTYDRIVDEKEFLHEISAELTLREAEIQRRVMALAGVPMTPTSTLTEDRSHDIVEDLPGLESR